MSVNALDMVIIGIVLWFGIAGFREGLILGVVKLAGFIITVILMAVFADTIGKLAVFIPLIPHKAAVIVVFMSVFIIVSIIFAILGNIIKKVVHLTPLGILDSGLGITIGIVKAVFLGGVLALIFSMTSSNGYLNKQYKSSYSGAPLAKFISCSIPVITSGGIKLFRQFSPQPRVPEPRNKPYAASNSL